MENSATRSPAHRPLGISIRAILVGVRGIQLLLISTIGLAPIIPGTSTPVYNWLAAQSEWKPIGLAGLAITLAILSFLCAWGLWMLKRWALWVIIVVQVVSIVISLALFIQGPVKIGAVVSDILLPLVILTYFFANKSIRLVLLNP